MKLALFALHDDGLVMSDLRLDEHVQVYSLNYPRAPQ